MSQALYRKYRSKSLSEIVGQDHVTNTLSQSLKQGKLTHAYLLTGPRGVGKTSIARILAHEITKLPYDGTNHLDIIEIDAASNNGVDDIRDLREKVALAPIQSAKKIYIIDEVHMLSKPAFNALLKTLEEPPSHVIFILATTEVHKLPDTILSRTQRFHFRAIDTISMVSHLEEIAKKEKISIEKNALTLIAERAQGSFRDAISLLDQLQNSSGDKITVDDITRTLGLASHDTIETLTSALLTHSPDLIVESLQHAQEQGVSAVVLADQLIRRLRTEVLHTPKLITAIERLIEVGRSFDPQLKLFAILVDEAQPKIKAPKSMPLAAPQPTLVVPAPAPPPKKKASTKAPSQKMEHTPHKEPHTAPEQNSTAPKDIDWSAVLDYIRTHHVVIYGVLQKADVTYQQGELALHFSFALHKKKIDDTKYRQMLTASLVELYGACPTIITTSGKRAPKDSAARDVAAIMGGGEEVKLP